MFTLSIDGEPSGTHVSCEAARAVLDVIASRLGYAIDPQSRTMHGTRTVSERGTFTDPLSESVNVMDWRIEPVDWSQLQ